MKTETKQRIIGGLVLAAIATIFIPFLFHQKDPVESQLTLTADIPQPPAATNVVPKAAPSNQQIAAAQAAIVEPMNNTDVSSSVAPQQAQTQSNADTDTLAAKAWVLRVGAFSVQTNSDAFVKKLRDAGYDVYQKTTKNANNQTLLVVFVGPELSKDKLLQMQKALKDKFNIAGLIQPYQVQGV